MRRAPLRLSRSRCVYCHRVYWFGAPAACGQCGYPFDRPEDAEVDERGGRTREGRLRIILLVGAVLVTGGGLAFRRLPEADAGRVAREAARGQCRDAMEAVLARRFALAAEEAERALVRLPRFPEARTVLALAWLGRGRYVDSAREAAWAEGDFAAGGADPLTIKAAVSVELIASRVRCVARAVGGAQSTLGPALFDAVVAFSRAPSCEAAEAELARTSGPVRSIMAAAVEACPQHFTCGEAQKPPAKP